MAGASRPAILALDLGTSVLKAGLVGLDGTELAMTRRAYPTLESTGRAEQRPQDWWSAVVDATRELMAEAGAGDAGRGEGGARRGEGAAARGSVAGGNEVAGAAGGRAELGGERIEVVAIALDGQGPTCVPTRADGDPAGLAIAWSDHRAVAERDVLSAATGLPAWLLGILPSALWLERHEVAVAAQASWYLAAWEWLGLRLSGVAASTVTHGQVVADRAMAAAAGLPSEKVPDAVAAGAVLGDLTVRAADALGLPAGIPVVAGLNDAYASCLGAGLLEAGDALDTGGSSGGLIIYADRPPEVPGAWIGPAPLPGRWLVGGAMAATGRALDWLCADILGGTATIDELVAEAAGTPPGAEGLVFLPYLAGERSPIWDASARGVFAGLTLRHGRGHLTRAVLEGAALALRHVAEPILAAGYAMDQLRVCGGPARSVPWGRIKADVLGIPVEVPVVTDTAMLGAAILGAVAIGTWPDVPTAIRSMVRIERRIEPDRTLTATYEALFAAYRDLYPALRPIMRGLDELEESRATAVSTPG
jgi:xylulokinase